MDHIKLMEDSFTLLPCAVSKIQSDRSIAEWVFDENKRAHIAAHLLFVHAAWELIAFDDLFTFIPCVMYLTFG